MGWLAILVPTAVELLWAAGYAHRYRRWQAARDEVSRRLGRPMDPEAEFEHQLVYVEVVLRVAVAGGDGVAQADADDVWARAYALYHLPILVLLRVVGRPADYPLLRFDWRAGVTMVGTAVAYAAGWPLVAGLVA